MKPGQNNLHHDTLLTGGIQRACRVHRARTLCQGLGMQSWTKLTPSGLPLRSSGQDSELLLQRAWVRSLVRELRSCMLCGMGKKTKTTTSKKKRKKKLTPSLPLRSFHPMVGRQNKSTLVQRFRVVSTAERMHQKGLEIWGAGGTKEQGFRLPGARQDVPPEELASTEAQR